jgi:hypothetical protein
LATTEGVVPAAYDSGDFGVIVRTVPVESQAKLTWPGRSVEEVYATFTDAWFMGALNVIVI